MRTPKKKLETDASGTDVSEEGAAVVAGDLAAKKKYAPSWSGVAQALTDEDLNSPAARKMLVNELSRLTEEVESLKSYREDYHRSDRECGILTERAAASASYGGLSALVVSIGSVVSGLGANQLFASIQGSTGSLWGGAGTGVVLILVGLAAVFAPVVTMWNKR